MIDPRWEYWEPDHEVAEIVYPSRLNDRTIAGYLGHVDGGFRFGCGESQLASLTNRTRVLATDPMRAKKCRACGRVFETRRVDQSECGRVCHNRKAIESRWRDHWSGSRVQRVDMVLQMRRAGVQSLEEIAAAAGVNRHTVNRWLRQAGLTSRHTKRIRRKKNDQT